MIMDVMNKGAVIAGGLVLAAIVVLQMTTTAKMKAEMEQLRAELSGVQESGVHDDPEGLPARPDQPRRTGGVSLGTLPGRVTTLEQSVAELGKISEYLVERGMVPPSEERLSEMRERFFDPNASDGDRLRGLRLLRREGQLTDGVALQALNWLQSSTNANTRRQLLRQLDGATNAVMAQPLLAQLGTEESGNVREELVDVLGSFANDPAIESKLWELAMNDPNGEVREEARDALTDGNMTPERVESLKQKATNPNASLDERLLALEGLKEADTHPPEVLAEMTHLVQTSTDPVVRAKLYDALDGINDPSLMAPLVAGLQDANPIVRERAADALGSFSSDPRIQEWLNHVIANDADPRVQREAAQALEQSRRRDRGRGR